MEGISGFINKMSKHISLRVLRLSSFLDKSRIKLAVPLCCALLSVTTKKAGINRNAKPCIYLKDKMDPNVRTCLNITAAGRPTPGHSAFTFVFLI